jgi:DNA mismatch repair protein MutS2
VSYLSEGGRTFENIVRSAEDSRVKAEQKLAEVNALEGEWKEKIKALNVQIDGLNKERERINTNARAESRRIINERTARAEELLDEIERIFSQEEISQTDLIKARTLKNRLKDAAFGEEEGTVSVQNYKTATKDNIKVGAEVYVLSLQSNGQVLSFNPIKGEAEVQCGSLKMHLKLSEMQLICTQPKKNNSQVKSKVKVVRNKEFSAPQLEINVIGETIEEALYDVDNFIDKAVMDNLEQIKVIHGVGTGKLRVAIAQHLKRHKNVLDYRSGKYGEGETGVTIITLK